MLRDLIPLSRANRPTTSAYTPLAYKAMLELDNSNLGYSKNSIAQIFLFTPEFRVIKSQLLFMFSENQTLSRFHGKPQKENTK